MRVHLYSPLKHLRGFVVRAVPGELAAPMVVQSKLTFNLGGPLVPRKPVQHQVRAAEPVRSECDGPTHRNACHPSGLLADRNFKHFQPRIGLAYKFSDKMVVRGGVGLTTIDLFTTNFNQNFEEYWTSVSVQQPSGDPRPAFFLSELQGVAERDLAVCRH